MLWLPLASGRDGLDWETVRDMDSECGGPGYGLLSSSPVCAAKLIGDCLSGVAGRRNPSPKSYLAVSAAGD